MTNRNYFPPNEPLAAGEMRISFPGSTPWPPTLSQSGTAIMVELGTDGFAPMAAYLGQEGWCLELEMREGSQHCQKGTPELLDRVLVRARSLTSCRDDPGSRERVPR